ncbi:lipoprotein NlpI [Pirellulimonas nuda]|uniref:Lipoprotein NlpI n=1 Tax=Pirellulimonas nuda TaxID=2528009 RepID=A0A518D5Q2_9BACT|nr:tetratricopeptide repeat protein [Pirellulimonas nuda]QDU86801.1 lipoprotein NlpI [Pirellulimonas nuda]
MDELLCKRTLASSLLSLAIAAASVASADDGVVYVGDLTAAQASSPKLPTLGAQSRQGGARPTLFAQPSAGAAGRPQPSGVPTQQPQQAAEAKPKGLFARLGWFGSEPAAPQQPVQISPRVDPRVQPAQYTRNERSPAVQTRRGDQRTGLLSGLFSDDSDKAPSMPKQQQRQMPPSISKQQLAHEPLAQQSSAGRPSASLAESTGRPAGLPMPMPTGRPAANASADSGIVFASDSPKPIAVAQPAAEPEAVFITDTPAPVAQRAAQPASQPEAKPAIAAADLLPKRLSPPSYLDNTPATTVKVVSPTQPAPTASSPQQPKPLVMAQPAATPTAPTGTPTAGAINNAFVLSPPQATLSEQTPPAHVAVAAAPQAGPVVKPADEMPAPREFNRPAIVLPNPVAVQAPVQQQPSDRAADLLTEANAVAQRAVNEAELTEVVQRCRHVLAIDHSEVAVKYSNELAAWALNKRGELRADAGQGDLAMNDFEDALRMDTAGWRPLHNRGVLLAQQGAYAEAFEAFNRTISLNNNFAKAFSNRAALYVQAGDLGAALRDFQRAIEIDPDLAVAHKGRGRVCHMLGKMDEALQHLDAAMMLTPGDAQVASSRADLLMDMGRYAQAIEGYRQSIALDQTLPTPYRNLAWLEATCPDPAHRNGAEAVAHAQRAIELSAEVDDISLDTLAAAQAAAGDYEGAVQTLGQAIVIAPAADAEGYSQRLALYKSGQCFTTEPVAPVKTASYLR